MGSARKAVFGVVLGLLIAGCGRPDDSGGTPTPTPTPTPGPGITPPARMFHAAVWTGTEMLVWGGRSTTDSFDGKGGGVRYDPASDTWGGMTISVGAPVARSRHTAVWTGSQMVIWGGQQGTVYLRSGSFYDPAADDGGQTDSIWTEMDINGSPTNRTGHTAIWTGSEVVFWGGQAEPSQTSEAGSSYVPADDNWALISTFGAPSSRQGHTAVWSGTEMLVWGGDGTVSPGRVNTGAGYDPQLNQWSPTSTQGAPAARTLHTAVWTGTDMIVWGGEDGSALGDGGRYNPSTDMWGSMSTVDAPSARSWHTAVWTGTEMIVWGGSDDTDTPLATGARYNPATDTWTPMSTTGAPVARSRHTAVWTGTEMIIWGGWDHVDANGTLHSGGRYDPSTDTWQPTAGSN